MHQLTVDGLDDCVFLAAYRHFLFKVFWSKRTNGIENTLPSSLPVSDDIRPRRLRANNKLHIAVAIGLLSIGCQEVSPT